MSQPNLEHLSLKELRAYVFAHRGDNEALRYYMDRLRDDPNVTHHSGGPDELINLEQLFQEWSD